MTRMGNRHPSKPARDAHAADQRDRIIVFIKTYVAANGYPPTRREIAEAIGASSTDTVQHHISRLVDEGRLSVVQGQQRAIRVL